MFDGTRKWNSNSIGHAKVTGGIKILCFEVIVK